MYGWISATAFNEMGPYEKIRLMLTDLPLIKF